MITFKQKGNFNKTNSYFQRLLGVAKLSKLDKYGKEGVEALKAATPADTGKTANSWTYEIERNKDGAVIYWSNTNINDGVPIALILQYGHGTGGGGYVPGTDYINPAIRPVFKNASDDIGREMKNS